MRRPAASNWRQAVLAQILAQLTDDELRWLIALILEYDRNMGGPIPIAQLRQAWRER